MVNANHPGVVGVTGVFVVLSICGFFWMNKVIVMNSVSYLSELNPFGSTMDAGTTAVCAGLFFYILYIINYPEGQLAKDAAASFVAKKD